LEKFKIDLLSASHLEDAHRLYSHGVATAPFGFLASRSRHEFEDLLAHPERTIAVGAWEDGRLVAYSICHQIRRNPYPEVRILRALEPETETIYQGDGTVVHPDYRGRLLMQRLYEMRRRHLLERKVDHTVGLVSVGNVASLGNVLIAGGLLVGFADDESGENFVGYAGRLTPRLLENTGPLLVGFEDRERQRECFDSLNPVRALSRAPASGSDKRDLEFAVKLAGGV